MLFIVIAASVNLFSNPDIEKLSEPDHKFPMVDMARNPKQIGNLVRRARKHRKWSQTQLGERPGLRQETIPLIESGNLATRVDTMLTKAAVQALIDEIRAAAGDVMHRLADELPPRFPKSIHVSVSKAVAARMRIVSARA